MPYYMIPFSIDESGLHAKCTSLHLLWNLVKRTQLKQISLKSIRTII